MTVAIISFLIASFAIFLVSKKRKRLSVPLRKGPSINDIKINKTDEIVKVDIEKDENGNEFYLKEIVKKIPRKTYIIGRLNGKYYGEIDNQNEILSSIYSFYNFKIYDAEIFTFTREICSCLNSTKKICFGLHIESEGEFQLSGSTEIPIDKLPEHLICKIKLPDSILSPYKILLHNVKLSKIEIDRLLHQEDENEIFGTLEADITGYLLDFRYETIYEKEYISLENKAIDKEILNKIHTPLKTGIATGNTQFSNGYTRTEYYYDDYQSTYWSSWKLASSVDNSFLGGCIPTVMGIFGIIAGILFLLLILPKALWLFPIAGLFFILSQLSSTTWRWLLNGVGFLVFIIYILAIISSIAEFSIPLKMNTHKEWTNSNSPSERQKKAQYTPILANTNESDTLISLILSWSDYKDTIYTGTFSFSKIDLLKSKEYKNNLNIDADNPQSYDQMLNSLAVYDANKLGGLYYMFDSLYSNRSLSQTSMADMIVSFVQDFPFTLLLRDDCNPALYNDALIREYLSDSSHRCKGFEKFGIYTPMEFLYYETGDCDSRTLLLFIILSHYNYNVCVLSSELYRHSMLGITLPYHGIAYTTITDRYIVWETTIAKCAPGLMTPENSDLSNWRISLKSNKI